MGSFRLYVRHAPITKESALLKQLREQESSLKLLELQTYIDFRDRVQKNKTEMLQFLEEQKRLGKKVSDMAPQLRAIRSWPTMASVPI